MAVGALRRHIEDECIYGIFEYIGMDVIQILVHEVKRFSAEIPNQGWLFRIGPVLAVPSNAASLSFCVFTSSSSSGLLPLDL